MQPFSLEDMGSLALLAKVVELRSFSAAARDLGLAKSAVSKRIAVLEKKLGVRLLVRTTRQVTLSDIGLQVHEHCAALLGAARGAAVALQATDAGERGVVRINAPGLFAQRVMAPLLQRYLQVHPQVEVELNSDDAMIDLTSGRFDVVIRIARVPQEQSIVARPLGADRLVLVGAPAYLASQGTPSDPHELAHHSCMRYVQRTAAVEWRFKGEGGPLVVPVRSRFAAGDDATLREAAVAGLGLTIMPRCFVAEELAGGRLAEVLKGRLWQPERTVHALLPEGRLAPARVKKLVTFLADEVRLDPGTSNASRRKRVP
jgi:DNA-binding transcriptional LysR family regulator